MTIATISIIVGVALLILLKLFFKEEETSDQDEGLHLGDQEGLTGIDASDDPGLAHLPGNSYHYSRSANHSDQE